MQHNDVTGASAAEGFPPALYVHVPFCARRCSYCDFAIAVRREVPAERFVAAVHAELRLRYPNAYFSGLNSVYLGGGTPSSLGTEWIARLLDPVLSHAPATVEVTLEANPEDVNELSARMWRAAGVNRVSLGVQTFSPELLDWMHRVHDADRARKALSILCSEFQNVSADLIFATPTSVPRSFGADLDELLRYPLSHISLYGLTMEPHTPFARWVERGTAAVAGEDVYEQEYLTADQRLTDAGFVHYEVSNFARPGRESRHNSAYWGGTDYAGIGPSAHEYRAGARRWNQRHFAEWCTRVEAGADPVEGAEELVEEQVRLEAAYLGLRTRHGISVAGVVDPLIVKWVEAGWASFSDRILRLTAAGWLRLDAIVSALTDSPSR